jgi:hypothetical protein
MPSLADLAAETCAWSVSAMLLAAALGPLCRRAWLAPAGAFRRPESADLVALTTTGILTSGPTIGLLRWLSIRTPACPAAFLLWTFVGEVRDFAPCFGFLGLALASAMASPLGRASGAFGWDAEYLPSPWFGSRSGSRGAPICCRITS